MPPKLEKAQIQKLKKFKKTRSNQKVQKSLAAIQKAAQTENENLMPKILEAVENNATLGEISDALRSVFGEYKEQITI